MILHEKKDGDFVEEENLKNAHETYRKVTKP